MRGYPEPKPGVTDGCEERLSVDLLEFRITIADRAATDGGLKIGEAYRPTDGRCAFRFFIPWLVQELNELSVPHLKRCRLSASMIHTHKRKVGGRR